MIYQVNDTFKFFNYSAKVEGKEENFYLRDKTEFEEELKERFIKEQERKIMENEGLPLEEREKYTPPEDIELPQITYGEINISEEQLARLNECQGINANLDDVKFYVLTGDFPQGNHSLEPLEIKKLKRTISDLSIALTSMIGL